MANPLKMLKLKPAFIQIMQEVPIDAPPAKVWRTLISGAWFGDPQRPSGKIEPKIGGLFTMQRKDASESRLFGFVSHLEPNKLLRIFGPGPMSHLPATCTMIWELQPQKGGKSTLLRFVERAYGAVTPDIKKSHTRGWKEMFATLKAMAQKA
jgi:uncharacterized protein YndB with AHSA1/START domain